MQTNAIAFHFILSYNGFTWTYSSTEIPNYAPASSPTQLPVRVQALKACSVAGMWGHYWALLAADALLPQPVAQDPTWAQLHCRIVSSSHPPVCSTKSGPPEGCPPTGPGLGHPLGSPSSRPVPQHQAPTRLLVAQPQGAAGPHRALTLS